MGGRRNKQRELKGTVYIVGEGITEQYYFAHLKHLRKYSCSVKPRFFGKTSIPEIERTVKKLLLGGVMVICVFDADVAVRDPAEQEKLEQFRKKYGKNKRVIICDSLPSIEFWFLLHYVTTTRQFQNSDEVVKELKKYLPGYRKEKTYLENPGWVEKLYIDGKLEQAIKRAKAIVTSIQKRHISNQSPYSSVFKAIDWLNKKNAE